MTLRPPDYHFDPDALRAAITPRTRLLLAQLARTTRPARSSPASELELIAEVCASTHDLIAVTDEVYEHLVFDGEHIPLATLPGMRDRTVTISSAGKTFSFTGWKIGWVCAPPELLDCGADREAVPHLRQRRAVPVRDRRRPRPARRALRRRSPPTSGRAATC